MKIHKAGYNILAILLISVLIVNIIAFLFIDIAAIQLLIVLISIFLLGFVLRFFRVPSRRIKYQEGDVLSPADGKVVAIEEVFEDEFLHRKVLQISVFMSVWNVHINWFPVSGEMVAYKYHPGKFFVARNPKSSTLNERTSVLIKDNRSRYILARQIAGVLARRIENYAQKKHTFVSAGQQMGFIKFGSRVDLLLPLNAKINVKLGQQVRGQKNIIARLPGLESA